MIRVEGLSVHFGGVVSLDQMTIEFPEGTCGLIGPNGAGKTTFFNVMSGFVRPRSGRIDAMGQDLLALPMRSIRRIRGREIAMIFQDPMAALNPSVAVGRQIAEVVRLHDNTSQRVADRRAVELQLARDIERR